MKKTNLVQGFMLVILLAMTTGLMATSYTVTEVTDDCTGDVNTLSWAINQSNATIGVDDNIAFNLSSGSTITMSAALPIITDAVTIDGDDGGTVVTVKVTTPGTSTFRVFNINASGETVSISNMTIKGGDISSHGNNTDGYGGGIYFGLGTLSLDAVTMSGSKAYNGGGMYNNLTSPTLTNCTISDNSANNYGGGGMYNDNASPTLTNCTISGNSAAISGGGILNKDISSSPILTNCTISGNSADYGGGMYGSHSGLHIKNTILANNTASNGPDYYKNGGTVTDNGYNIVEYSYSYTWSGTGDIIGDQANLWGTGNQTTPALADNDTGFGTQTLALSSGSVAINAGSNTANGSVSIPATDQRGGNRIDAVDIGAYEFGSDSFLPVTLTSFDVTYSKNNVVLNWITESETDNLGFNLFRSENENGLENENLLQINSVLIDGMGTTSTPTNYSFSDEYPSIEGITYYYWLQSVSTSSELELFGPVSIEIPITGQLPTMTILESNYPNPFNPETTISFNIKENETGVLSIFNLKGEKILKQEFETGNHQYHWNAEGLASGFYFYKLSSPTTNKTKKMILMK
jgi:Secretion system C-terminal sorting domain